MDVALLLILVGSASESVAAGMLDCFTFFLLLALWGKTKVSPLYFQDESEFIQEETLLLTWRQLPRDQCQTWVLRRNL